MAHRFRVTFLDLKMAQSTPSKAISHAQWYESRFIHLDVEASMDSHAMRLGWNALEVKLGHPAFRSDYSCFGAVKLS